MTRKVGRPLGSEERSLAQEVTVAVASLERLSTKKDVENLVRFGINPPKAIGVSMANLQKLAKRVGRRHDLALALWESGWYEARMLAALVDDPAFVTRAQMDRWCRDFDNWGIVDTVCFKLFDQSPHAWGRVAAWRTKRDEFGKRAAFALLASLAGHDRTSGDAPFLEGLRFIEEAATDDRHFVKKGVSWALRRIGTRGPSLRRAAVDLSRRLAASDDPAARWLGKDALRDLERPRR